MVFTVECLDEDKRDRVNRYYSELKEKLSDDGIDPDFLIMAIENTSNLARVLSVAKAENDMILEERKKILQIIQQESSIKNKEIGERLAGCMKDVMDPEEIVALDNIPQAMDQADSYAHRMRLNQKYNWDVKNGKNNGYVDNSFPNTEFKEYYGSQYERNREDYKGYDNN
jgi:hypothetical protein